MLISRSSRHAGPIRKWTDFLWSVSFSISSGTVPRLTFGFSLQMTGVCGLSCWQWLFVIEGLFGFLVGGLFTALFPKSSENPVNLFGQRYFTEQEAHILTRRILIDDPTKSQCSKNFTTAEVKRTVSVE
jgi:hypothetical protein